MQDSILIEHGTAQERLIELHVGTLDHVALEQKTVDLLTRPVD